VVEFIIDKWGNKYGIALNTDEKYLEQNLCLLWPESIAEYLNVGVEFYQQLLIKAGGKIHSDKNYYFETIEQAQKCIDTILIPELVMSKL
jgi:hypothetical protein